MKRGLIVFLNGTSSSGKTSISMELINQKEIMFYHLSIDDFFGQYKDFIHNNFPDIDLTREVANVGKILLDPIISVYYATIKLFSEMGLNVIVDKVIDNDKRFNDYRNLLSDHPTLFVGVLCSKEELTRREQIRGDRQIGLANSQYDQVYSFNEYDLKVNTEELSPTECAEKILSFIKSGQDYSGLRI
ncbi:chloramphenicol phosphotransferase CPT family protein [Paenibacillus tepidiphilus]|uniref:chloramphenicol phosphotransferase CPT family protein n=1 Tax=Paenibacillus tepidiphilus TaxID=2608683 RepID=UPI00123A7B7B|nr:AAA family ATPase [Paenibacillus tepidiphilus]